MAEVRAGRMPTIPAADIDEATSAPLRYWRGRRNLTQTALARLAGVSQAYVAQIETGQCQGDAKTLAGLSRALGVRIEDLLAE